MTTVVQMLPTLNDTIMRLDGLSYRYQVELNQDQMLALSEYWTAKRYIDVRPAMVQAILDAVPPFKNDALPWHEGKRFCKFRYGLEDSRVLYVMVNKNNHLYIPEDSVHWTTLRERLAEIGTEFKADESNEVEESPFSIVWRYWWD